MNASTPVATHVVVARYVVREGESEAVLAALRQAATLTRREPGCLEFRAHVADDDPRGIVLYEEYLDPAAFAAHCATEHFADLILGVVVPRLESRERAGYTRVT